MHLENPDIVFFHNQRLRSMAETEEFKTLPNIEITEGKYVQMITQGFEVFSEAALKLQTYYRGLEEKISILNDELAKKNKELELNLLEKERVKNYLSNIFQNSAVGIIVTDLDGQITSVNQNGLKLTGYSLEEVRGKHFNDFIQTPVLPWAMSNDQLTVYEDVELREIDFQKSDGNKLRLSLYISLMYSENNDILGLIINIQDITELKKLEAEAERKNRFTFMGEMAASIAHEIRNPLGSIELFSSLLKKEFENDSPQKALLNHISSAIKSMNNIVSNLLEYSKPRPYIIGEEIEFHAFLKEILNLSQYMIEQNQILLHNDWKAEITSVRGDVELLKQVFLNLMMNAVQSMIEPGSIILKTRNLEKKIGLFPNHVKQKEPSAKIINSLEVQVEDTGIGIPNDIMNKIFDPFFTTKERGTGLGLAIVQNLLEAHGALLNVESEEGCGTRITITFPIYTKNV